MDFIPELIAFQGVIISADNKYSFYHLTSRGGNEENLEKVCEIIYKFVQQKFDEGNPEKHKSIMRKLCFYIVLNSNFRALDEIVEIDDLGHLIWTTPTITSCLFYEIVFKLQIESYIGEVITYSCPKLSVEILKTLVNGIRYCSAQDSIEKLQPLALATYHALCRLSYFNYDNVLTTNLISDLYTYFLRIITHFVSPPNNGKLEMVPEEERYVHLGKAFQALLSTTVDCLEIFQSSSKFCSDQFGMYTSTVSTETLKRKCLPNSVREDSEPVVLEYLHKCNSAALDKCVEIVMKVSIDVFCYWSEVTQNGQSLQLLIGQLCYNLHNALKQSPELSKHMLLSMLPQLSCKPANIFDIIREADENDLITNAQANTTDREHWLNAIIERNNLFDSKELTDCIVNNVAFLKQEACENLYKRSIVNLENNNYLNENAKTLAAKSFVGVDSAKKGEFILKLFPNKTFHSHLMESDFEHRMNEIFNKLISTSDASVSEVFDIFIQNPYCVLEKMLNVGIENLKQANLIMNTIVTLKQFSEHCCDGDKEPAFLRALEDICATPLETEIQESSFVSLFSGLCKEISSLQYPLLMRIVMPYVYNSLINKDYRTMKLYLRVLEKAYDVESLIQYRAPLLAMLGQVLNEVRWDLTTYTAEAPETLQNAIDLQIKLFSSYNARILEKDANWLKTKLKNLKPLNMYYYKELWNPPGDNFIQVITNNQKIQLEDYPIILAKILNSCTQKEWAQIWNSLAEENDQNAVLDLVYKALVTMITVEINHRSDKSRNCIRYCYRCFTHIIKEQFLTDPANREQVDQMLDKFVSLANTTNDEDIEEIENIMLPLLVSIASKSNSGSVPYIEIVNRLNNGKFAKLVENVLINST